MLIYTNILKFLPEASDNVVYLGESLVQHGFLMQAVNIFENYKNVGENSIVWKNNSIMYYQKRMFFFF